MVEFAERVGQPPRHMIPRHRHIGPSIVRDRHRRDTMNRRFSSGGKGAADEQIDAQISARVDAREHHLDLRTPMREGGADTVDRRATQRDPARPHFIEGQGMSGGDAVSALATSSVGRDDEDLNGVAQRGSDRRLESSQARRFDPIIVGQQNLQVGLSPITGRVGFYSTVAWQKCCVAEILPGQRISTAEIFDGRDFRRQRISTAENIDARHARSETFTRGQEGKLAAYANRIVERAWAILFDRPQDNRIADHFGTVGPEYVAANGFTWLDRDDTTLVLLAGGRKQVAIV